MTLKTWKDLEQLKELNIIWLQGKGKQAEFYLEFYVGGRSPVLFLFVETTYLHHYIISILPWDTELVIWINQANPLQNERDSFSTVSIRENTL